MSYFFKFEDISDSDSVLGAVERTAAIVHRHCVANGVTVETTVFHVNFYFDDWNSDEILAADRFDTDGSYEVYSDVFWKTFTLKPYQDKLTEEDVENLCHRLIEYANLRSHEWKNVSFNEDHPLYVKIDL
jgi:hypothetical protein